MNSHDQPTQLFFEELLAETGRCFKKTDVYKKQQAKNSQWNYSVCGTPILKNEPIFFGINWGGSGVGRQKADTQWDDITAYPFIKRNRIFLENGLKLNFSDINFNYTNFCFFRSPKADDLSAKDYDCSIPLFKKYVTYINPPWLLAIGNTSFNKLRQYQSLDKIVQYQNQTGKVNGFSAKLWDLDVYTVPHPNARLSNTERNAIWTCAIDKINPN